MDHPLADDDEVRAFSPPSGGAENLTCQLLIVGAAFPDLARQKRQ